jgi:phage tail sheath protein FI
MKTPGVYIVEKNAFPNSVVEVATAVPAFIGYTEKADNKGKPLKNTPWRISSMAEFQSYFGGPPPATFHVGVIAPAPAPPNTPAPPAPVKAFTLNGKDFQVSQAETIDKRFLLYYSMVLFFQNGGGPCYIVSVGDYSGSILADDLLAGIDLLLKEQEPTMVVMPDAVHLADAGSCIKVQQAALLHCGEKMQSRVAILDIYNGFRDQKDPAGDPVSAFRGSVGINQLNYGAAYYPWLNTSVVGDRDVTYANFVPGDLTALLNEEKAVKAEVVSEVTTLKDFTADLLHKTLVAGSPIFGSALSEVKKVLNLQPPSAALAGIYTMVDNSLGVWKAPANVSINSVVSPTVNISHEDQENLNVDVQGKSINAIRAFIGEGVLVWGARTLDGNSLDWRYVSVRRTMIMLEQSIKLATKAYVFDNNVSTTWVTIKSMIRNFLTGIWKRGGLAGASPDDAFAVFCGLGETMTPEDILEGILRVTVLVAVTRPAEFIEITFEQQMQKS